VLALGPAIVVLILGAITFDGIRRSSQSRALVAHTRDIIDRAQSTLSALQDAETGERGFLITGEPSYLEPYDRGVSSLASDTTALRALTTDNAAQQRRLDSLCVDPRADAASRDRYCLSEGLGAGFGTDDRRIRSGEGLDGRRSASVGRGHLY